MKSFTAAALAAAAVSLLPGGVAAQDGAAWPQQQITIVVPFAPGGNTDLIARAIAQPLGEKLGQTVIVDNRPGAGGTIGTAEVAAAEPDGYTMQIGDISTHGISPVLYPSLSYDPIADFQPLIQITTVPLLLVVNPQVPVESVEELVAFARSEPDGLIYASSGIGSPQHLAFEYFRSAADFEATHIPYNGAAPAQTDLIGGHVQAMIDGTAVPAVQDGSLRALAITGTERSAVLPDVPTMQEEGLTDFEFASWHGILFPAGVPEEIVQRTNDAINEILEDETIRERFAALNINLAGGSPEDFASLIVAESEKMRELVELSGATPD